MIAIQDLHPIGILALVVGAACSGCTTKVTTNVVRGAETEQRIPVDDGSVDSSTWHWDGRGFTGTVKWRTCRIETSWKETEQHTSSSRTTAVVPVLVAAAGLSVIAAGFATYDYDGVKRECNDTVGICYDVRAYNTKPSLLMAGGGALTGLAIGMTVIKTKPVVSDGKTEQKQSIRNAPCIQAKDLGELVLVLQVSERKFVTIELERDGSARIPIPQGIELPRGVDLPVLVYRVPAKASQVVERWSIIGHARADADGPAR